MKNNPENLPQGILLVNKSLGKSSFFLVRILRKLTSVKKIGHAGTLDPLATGLMIMLIGKNYTKKADSFISYDKQYLAKIYLGASTDTLDREGKILEKSDHIPTLSEIEKTLESFQGNTTQIPPMYSAKKVKGQKLCDLARKGIEIERKPISVRMEIDLIQYKYPYLEVKVTCSKGTYIRTLADDIGKKLTCGAHLFSLCRTKVGPYELKDSIDQENLKDNFCINSHLIS